MLLLNLMRAEWLKLTRRPMTWLLLGVFLLLMLLSFTMLFFLVGVHEGTFSGMVIQVLNEPQIEQYRNMLRFPGILGSVLGQINSFGGICAIILTAGAFGSEYSWGTLRMQLARQPRRGLYLAAKTLTLLALLLVGMAVALLVGALLAWLYGSILGDVGSVSRNDILMLPLAMLRALYVMLPYILLTIAACVTGRSVLAGVVGGAILLAVDAGSVGTLSLMAQTGAPLPTFFLNLILQQNINVLIVLNRASYGFAPELIAGINLETLPPLWQATLVIACYCALFASIAYFVLTRRDLGGAG